MPRARFVVPSTKRIPLSEGDWLEVKSELSYGEVLELNNAFGAEGFDQKNYNLMRAALWIVDWSFTDGDGKPVPWPDDSEETMTARELLERRKTLVASLDRATGVEIVAAINQAEDEAEVGKVPMEEMRIETKMNGSSSPSPTGSATVAVPASV